MDRYRDRSSDKVVQRNGRYSALINPIAINSTDLWSFHYLLVAFSDFKTTDQLIVFPVLRATHQPTELEILAMRCLLNWWYGHDQSQKRV